LLETIAKHSKGKKFHYKQALDWMRKEHPKTYQGKTPHITVHRDLSASPLIKSVGHNKGMFRMRGSSPRPASAKELRRAHKKALKLLREATRVLEAQLSKEKW